MPLILGTNSIKDTGYDVANSLRFNDGSSDHLTRSLGASETSTQKGTFSFWVKRGQLTTAQMIYTNEVADNNNRGQILFEDDDTFMIRDTVSGSNTTLYATSQLFRDTSAWYHMVVALDSTQAGGNRIRVYKNGTRIPDAQFGTSTEPNQNSNFNVLIGGQTNKNHIGKVHGGSNYFDGYLAEFVYCDGQVLDPTSFGEFDEDSGIWKPIDVSGLTFGTNGFYLDFENSGSLGADVSGNGNNFTVNNLTAIDQTTDTCTNNFATINPLDNFYFNANYIQDGNLHVRSDGSSYSFIRSTFGVSTGKWYWEVEFDAQQIGAYSIIGIESKAPTSSTQGVGDTTNGYGYYADNGNVRTNNGNVGGWSGSTYAVGDIIGVALDLDNNKLYFSKNGTFQNSGDPTSGATGTGAVSITAPSSTSSGFYFPAITFYDATGKGTFKLNFGNPMETISSGNTDGNGYGNFEYAVPSGYYALNTKNLAEYG